MKIGIVVMQVMFSLTSFAQTNLIQNGDFENNICPTGFGQIGNAIGWSSPTDGTPELFSSCATLSAISVPGNLGGWQQAHSSNSYAGINSFQQINYREYIQNELIDTLQAGKKYILTFNVSLGEVGSYANNSIGALFSDTLLSMQLNATTIPLAPLFENTGIALTDTGNWQTICDTIIATGGEKFVSIGCFRNDDSVDTISSVGSFPKAYYFIDDVSLYEDTTTSINEYKKNKLDCYPNPFINNVYFNLDSYRSFGCTVYNLMGEKVFEQKIYNERFIDLSNLGTGIYLLELKNEKQIFSCRLIKF